MPTGGQVTRPASSALRSGTQPTPATLPPRRSPSTAWSAAAARRSRRPPRAAPTTTTTRPPTTTTRPPTTTTRPPTTTTTVRRPRPAATTTGQHVHADVLPAGRQPVRRRRRLQQPAVAGERDRVRCVRLARQPADRRSGWTGSRPSPATTARPPAAWVWSTTSTRRSRRMPRTAPRPMVIQFVIYNLPGRDCAALASNGELGPTEIDRYRNDYINPIAEILRRPAYANLRIVTIIEVDSLPNLVTNADQQAGATQNCRDHAGQRQLRRRRPVRAADARRDSQRVQLHRRRAPRMDRLELATSARPPTCSPPRVTGATGGWNNVAGFIANTANYLGPAAKCTSPSTPASTASRCATRDGSTSTTTSTS